jgi:hypothetical protein
LEDIELTLVHRMYAVIPMSMLKNDTNRTMNATGQYDESDTREESQTERTSTMDGGREL